MTVFHREPPPWLSEVSDLRPGGKRRLSDGVLVSFNGKSYHHYDFRDRVSEVYEPELSLAERLALHKQGEAATAVALQDSAMPQVMRHPRDWPVQARSWLHAAGLNNIDIDIMGAGWSAELQRVVIPVEQLDGSTHWIARRINGIPGFGPKYLMPNNMRRSGGALIYRGPGEALERGRSLVLTEDYLSAYRVANDAVVPAMALLGTSLDRDTLVELADAGLHLILWLDPDEYGQRGERELAARLSAMDVPFLRPQVPFEPKELRADAINEVIHGRRTDVQH